MKQVLLSVCVVVTLNVAVTGQDFKETLKNTVAMFDTAGSPDGMFAAANRLDLISKKWDTSAIAQYYCAYAFTILSFVEPDEGKKDAYLDKSDAYLAKARELAKKDNDEFYVMAAFIANARLAVKPQSRWKKYGDIFNDDIAKAREFNPDNPRIYYLQGNSIYHTPKMFGGGEKNALPYFQKADTLFKNETDTNIFKPYWGKEQNSDLLKKCQTEMEEQD